MVYLTIAVDTKPGKHQELLSALRFFSEKTRSENGCLNAQVYQAVDNVNLINLKETWKLRSDLDGYFRSDIFSALIGAMKLLGETHQIQINDGSQIEGMEAVKRAQAK